MQDLFFNVVVLHELRLWDQNQDSCQTLVFLCERSAWLVVAFLHGWVQIRTTSEANETNAVNATNEIGATSRAMAQASLAHIFFDTTSLVCSSTLINSGVAVRVPGT